MATDEVETAEPGKPEIPNSATAGLIYAPTGRRRRRGRRPRPVVAYRRPDGKTSSAPAEPNSAEQGRPVLGDAFQYHGDGLDDERAIRAASFLLDWATAEGNEQVDAALAQGISRALSIATDNIAREADRRACE